MDTMLHINLPQLMRDRAMTPEALAVKLQDMGHDTRASAVRSWMAGSRTPGLAVARLVATALDCSIDDLLADEVQAVV